MKFKFSRMTAAAITNLTIVALLVVTTFGSTLAFAQVVVPLDPALEVFRIRCQIDTDIDPVTGLAGSKVQIQAKVRADILDGQAIGVMVENISVTPAPLPSVINSTIEFGSAAADWNTFPGVGADPAVKVIAGDFAVGDDIVKITAQVAATGQTVTDVGTCAAKTAAQFKQQTKSVCKLKDFNRGKCKSGDILPDGTTMP